MPVLSTGFSDGCSDPYREFLIQLYAQYQQLRIDVDELTRIVKGGASTAQMPPSATIDHTHMLTEGTEVRGTGFEVRDAGSVIEVEDVENVAEHEEESPLTLDQITCKAIAEALERNGNNREKAAAELGISARTIYRKIKEFNLE